MNWVENLLGSQYAHEFLRAFASSTGSAAGPLIMGAFGALWAKALGDKKRAERTIIGEALKPTPVHREITDFHSELKASYCGTQPLRRLKENGTLPRLAKELAGYAGDEYKVYVFKMSTFFRQCYNQTNKSKTLDNLFDDASAQLPKSGKIDDDAFNALKSCVRRSNLFGWLDVPSLQRARRSNSATARGY
jgi:hypothetical protein